MRQAYADMAGPQATVAEKMREAKLRMIRINFAGETNALVEQGADLLGLDEETMRRALEEVLLAFPRYRTYGAQGKMSAGDRELLDQVLPVAKTQLNATTADAAWSIIELLKGQKRLEDNRVEEDIFRRRFQQLTGPLMAKSLSRESRQRPTTNKIRAAQICRLWATILRSASTYLKTVRTAFDFVIVTLTRAAMRV